MELLFLLIGIYFLCLFVAYKGASKENDEWYPVYFFNIKKGDTIRVINKHLEDSGYDSAIMGLVIEVDIIENNNRFIVMEVKYASKTIKTLKLNLYSGSYEKLAD